MLTHIMRRSFAFGVVPLLLVAVSALGGDGVALTITNDGIDDIFVTVYDMNTRPRTAVLEHERINGFTTVPIFATADASGQANLTWSAISVDDRARQCGHEARVGLDDNTLVNVRADSSCSVRSQGG